MRSIICMSVIILLALNSCKEKGNNDILEPQDTSLYISVTMNEKDIKYYQRVSNSSGIYVGSSMLIDGKNVSNYRFDYFFLNPYDQKYPQVELCFWDTIGIRNNNFKMVKLSSRIKQSYKFTSPKLNRIDLVQADTIFMVGAALFLTYKNLSTQALFENLKYDYDIFSNPILKDSHLIIERINPLSENTYLVEGHFNTSLMNSVPEDNLPESMPISGRFKFVIN
jgi:hypothetical protein